MNKLMLLAKRRTYPTRWFTTTSYDHKRYQWDLAYRDEVDRLIAKIKRQDDEANLVAWDNSVHG